MLNKSFLMGRLTKDPEIRYTSENNVPVAKFTLAVDDGYGEKKKTYFINCVAWNKTAEFINNYFTKGKMMVLVGRIQTRTWDDQEGKKHYATEIIAEEVSFAGDKGQAEEDNGSFPVDGDDQELPY